MLPLQPYCCPVAQPCSRPAVELPNWLAVKPCSRSAVKPGSSTAAPLLNHATVQPWMRAPDPAVQPCSRCSRTVAPLLSHAAAQPQWNRCTEANAQRSPSATRSVPFVTTMHNRSGDDPGGATMKLVFQEGCQRGPMPVQHSTSHHTGLMSPVSRTDVWLSTVDADGNAAIDTGPMPAWRSISTLRWL